MSVCNASIMSMLDVFVCVCVPTNIGLFNNELIWDIWLPCLTFYLLWRLNQFNSHCKRKYNETREKSKFWPRMDINSLKTRARLHPKFESIDLSLIKEILWMLAIEIVTKKTPKRRFYIIIFFKCVLFKRYPLLFTSWRDWH